MFKQCVLIADAARARFFAVQESGDEEAVITERRDLVNPNGKLTDHEMLRDRRGGRRSGAAGRGAGYASDEANSRHRAEMVRRFVRELADAASEFVGTRKADRLVVIASPRFLGLLRPQIRKAIPSRTEVVEFAEDLSWHALSNIQQALRKRSVIGEREPPANVYRPRAQHPRAR